MPLSYNSFYRIYKIKLFNLSNNKFNTIVSRIQFSEHETERKYEACYKTLLMILQTQTSSKGEEKEGFSIRVDARLSPHKCV